MSKRAVLSTVTVIALIVAGLIVVTIGLAVAECDRTAAETGAVNWCGIGWFAGGLLVLGVGAVWLVIALIIGVFALLDHRHHPD